MNPQITVMVDIDDVLFPLADNWIYHYKMSSELFSSPELYNSHDKHLDKSMITSWDIEACLQPTYKKLFWAVLDDDEFWADITVPQATKDALNKLNSCENIDLIICTDTYYKSATAKLTRFFELFPFIDPSQVICMKEKWRIDADIIIDDKPETLEKFMLKYNPPFAVIKISQPWNTTTICDYSWNEFNDGLARFCIDAADAYVDTIREIKQEEGDEYYERCYYN